METRVNQAVSALGTLGFTENEARVLVLFMETETELNQRQIERNCDLRQPEVSIAVSSLVVKGFVKKTDVIATEKGRPTNYYGLAMTIDEIITCLTRQVEESVRVRYDNIEYLEKAYHV